MDLFVGHGDGRTVRVVEVLVGVGPGIGVEHIELDGLPAAVGGEVARTEGQHDASGDGRRGVLVGSPVRLHDPACRLDGLLNVHDLFRRRWHSTAHLPHGAADDCAGNGMCARPARVFAVFAIGGHPDVDDAGVDLPAGLPVNSEALGNAEPEVVR